MYLPLYLIKTVVATSAKVWIEDGLEDDLDYWKDSEVSSIFLKVTIFPNVTIFFRSFQNEI